MKTETQDLNFTQGQLLSGCFCKVAHKTWWNCIFIKFDDLGNFIVQTEKGVKTFTHNQYRPNSIKRTDY